MLKTDKLEYKVYAKHGDMCLCSESWSGSFEHCVTGHKPTDYVLVASFAYLTEALDYCEYANKRKVSVQLRKPHYGPKITSDFSDYPANPSKFASLRA
jgi:hypothetical protein